MRVGVRVPVGPTVVGVVLAVLVVASASGVGVGPVDSAVNSTRTVTSDALGAVGVDVRTASDGSESVRVDETAIERAVQRRVNAEREAVARPPVAWSDPLHRVARFHSADMARNRYVAHELPAGNTTADRYERFGHDCDPPRGEESPRVGETLASITLDGTAVNETAIAAEVVERWVGSESHRQTLLANDWERAAVGVATSNRSGGQVVYVTQNFC